MTFVKKVQQEALDEFLQLQMTVSKEITKEIQDAFMKALVLSIKEKCDYKVIENLKKIERLSLYFDYLTIERLKKKALEIIKKEKQKWKKY